MDGCHLKGPYRGVLLAVVALDGNYGIFPIIVAIVELENGDSWGWLLHLLSSVIGDFSRPLVVMCNGQKVSKLNFFHIYFLH